MSKNTQVIENLLRETVGVLKEGEVAKAAEAYNVGKSQLAAAISAKGVETSPTETYPEMAEKVSAISQETYEIDGGEMYAKQLFGSLDTPNYWNLYEVLTQLLSDGRLVNYGGILLAEYYKGYDSLVLAGAGAGGAYVVSDKDADGNFKMYTADTTHTWATEDDKKGNRWVAYCFADEYHDFSITDTNTSPRSIFIGRKVGTITCLVNTRISQVVVPDGNELIMFNGGGKTQNFDKKTILRNVGNLRTLLGSIGGVESLYIDADVLTGGKVLGFSSRQTFNSLIVKANEISVSSATVGEYGACFSNITLDFLLVKCPAINYGHQSSIFKGSVKNVIILDCESLYATMWAGFFDNSTISNYIYLGYHNNDRTKAISLGTSGSTFSNPDLEIQDGWCKPLNVSVCSQLTEENIVNHILNRLGDNTGQAALTITLGATNLAKLTEEEKAIATNKGFTLA